MARKGQQKGAQGHAEGQHGDKTHARLIEQLQSGPAREPREEQHGHEAPGKHRLFEQRVQNDEADRNSDKNRLDQDIRAHGHNRENFQVPGGSASARATPRNPINPENPDAPTPGLKQPPPPDRVG